MTTDPDLRPRFESYVSAQMGRVLTQMDRDPDSPTRGSFDRYFWHYKTRDFSSAILQQSVLLLEALRRGDVRSGASGETITNWCVWSINNLAAMARRDGSVDEYYPRENSFVAAAFGLATACRVLLTWQSDALELHQRIDWDALRRLTRRVAATHDTHVANQSLVALAGLALAGKIAPLQDCAPALEQRADAVLGLQNAEGWFDEYGGPDFGYLSVALDALADYFDGSGDPRARDAMGRAIRFATSVTGADGLLPFTLGSRNTRFFLPYGLVRAAAWNPEASWLADTLFRDLGTPGHFLNAIDDRYLAHFTIGSFARALPHLGAMRPPAQPEFADDLWLPESGFWCVRSPDRSLSLCVAGKKGGALRLHRAGGSPVTDHGWRIGSSGGRWASCFWSQNWHVTKDGETLTVEGRLARAAYPRPTTGRLAILRLIAPFAGRWLKAMLRRYLVLHQPGRRAVKYRRTISLSSPGGHFDGLTIRDSVAGPGTLTLTPAPLQSVRYVPSADWFDPEEWQKPLWGQQERSGTRSVDLSTSWTTASDRERH